MCIYNILNKEYSISYMSRQGDATEHTGEDTIQTITNSFFELLMKHPRINYAILLPYDERIKEFFNAMGLQQLNVNSSKNPIDYSNSYNSNFGKLFISAYHDDSNNNEFVRIAPDRRKDKNIN